MAPLPPDIEAGRVQTELRSIRERIRSEIIQRLGSSRFQVVPAPSSADVCLKLRVIAYGRVPGKWVALLVGSGVIEAVVQGAVVERVTHNQWLALGVGGEELLSECATWLGGAFVTNRYLTPMIFNAQVIDSRTRKRLWHHDEASIYSHGAVSKLPRDKRRDRAAQLDATENIVIDKLVKALDRSSDRIASHLSL